MEHEVAHAGLTTLISPVVNVSILVGMLYYFLKKPVIQFVAERHTRIKIEVADVAVKLSKAKEKYEEFSAKLKAIETEIRILKEQTKQEAEQFKINVLTEAKKQASAIVVDAKNASNVAVEDFKKDILKNMAVQIMSQVERTLISQLTGADKVRLRKELASQVDQVGPGKTGGV